MKKLEFEIAGIPALLVGEPSEKLYLYVHGKMGCKEEALDFAERACPAGYQVLAIYVPELQAVYRYAAARWPEVSLRATSIGAWLSMQALQRMPLEKALLVSPVVDMEDLITHMMQWADVTGAQLEAKGEIPTTFGETLSWPYLCWVKEHPICWKVPTQVLYGGKDNLTSRPVIEAFCDKSSATLTVMEEGEHWFHTELQLAVLQEWERAHI